MGYIGDGPANSVLTGTAGNVNQFSTSVTMGGSITCVGLSNTGYAIGNYTATSTTPYVVVTNDYVIAMDASAGIKTVQLPNAPTTGTIFIVKDVTGSAAANNISVTSVSGIVLIDSAATYVMNANYQSVTVMFNGTKYVII